MVRSAPREKSYGWVWGLPEVALGLLWLGRVRGCERVILCDGQCEDGGGRGVSFPSNSMMIRRGLDI